ncbi:uncharacterized protein [Argopecten irradians]|uniref:uncharacterized protein isoform X2 n=1 Tax=Argopecten irradians TaxID=31199 RepID=UPI003715F090
MCVGELHCARFTLTQDSREKYSGRRTVFILKPSTMQNILLTTVILASLAAVAMAGMCVVCRSDRVSGCGETIDPKIINDYGQECANTTVCDKRINMEFETLVIRQCGSEAANDEEYFSSKCKEAVNHKVCKCRGNMCNSQSNVVSSLSVLTSAVLVVLALVR